MHKGKHKHNARLMQIALGVFLLLASYFLLQLCAAGSSMQDRDATWIAVTVPLGLYCIFSRETFINF